MSYEKIIQENGENIMPITYETCVLDDEGNPITETIGDVSLLNTESRNLVGAINEVFGDTIKECVVDALVYNNVDVHLNDKWNTLINAIYNITDSIPDDTEYLAENLVITNNIPEVREDKTLYVISKAENNDNINLITTNNSFNYNEGDIIIKDFYMGYTFSLATRSIEEVKTITYSLQFLNGGFVPLDVYYNHNNSFEKIVNQHFVFTNDDTMTSKVTYTKPTAGTCNYKILPYISMPYYRGGSNSTYYGASMLIDLGDCTNYNKLTICFERTGNGSNFDYFFIKNSSGTNTSLQCSNDSAYSEKTFDISSYSGNCKLLANSGTYNAGTATLNIYYIYLS